MPDKNQTIKRLRRIRRFLCPNNKFDDEVERCPCERGGWDAGLDEGTQFGCKDLNDAANLLENQPDA